MAREDAPTCPSQPLGCPLFDGGAGPWHGGVVAQGAAGLLERTLESLIEVFLANPALDQVVHHRSDRIELALIEDVTI